MTGLAEQVFANSLEKARAFTRVQLEAEMRSIVRITRGSEGVLGTGGELTMDPDAPTVYEGKARLANAQGPVTYTLGEEVQFFSSGMCTIPIEDPVGTPTTPQINDLVQILGGDDPLLVGRFFRIVDVEVVGILAGARRLQIVGVQRYPGWVDSAVRHPAAGDVPDQIPPDWVIDS